MNCPNCRIKMHDVRTESHYGMSIVIDQCPDCGGLWIDANELYRVKHTAAEEIELLDVSKLKATTKIINAELRCPRHHCTLIEFKDPYFPAGIQIEKCPICRGFWFNRGEFSQFQKARKGEMLRYKKLEVQNLENGIHEILRNDKKTKKTESLSRLGKFVVSGPERISYVREELGVAFNNYILATQTVIMVVRLLLRLLVK